MSSLSNLATKLFLHFGIPYLRAKPKKKIMVAGNIKIEDILNFKNKKYIIDVSGALEDFSGKKNMNKINQFLIEVNK